MLLHGPTSAVRLDDVPAVHRLDGIVSKEGFSQVGRGRCYLGKVVVAFVVIERSVVNRCYVLTTACPVDINNVPPILA
jgi:hypothetical protein